MSAELIASIRELGFDVLDYLHQSDPSHAAVIVSPLSLTIALGMLAGGATGDHRRDLCAKLGIHDPTKLGDAFGAAQLLLSSNAGQCLEMANGIFARDDYHIKPSYESLLVHFAAVLANYPNLPDATETINEWISDQTKGLIRDMLQKDMLEGAQIVLVNALAFKGTWEHRFDGKHTKKDHLFRIMENVTKPVEMMFRYEQGIRLADEEHYTAVSLPYQTAPGTQPMHFIGYLPHENRKLQEILPELRSERAERFSWAKLTEFGLPKFEIETFKDMTAILKELGYPLDGAYPEMGAGPMPDGDNAILHKAIVKLDEQGTEAAAATVVIRRAGSRPMPSAPRKIVFDRPFAFQIADDSGFVLFTGVFTKQ
jgi:serine protease inhibitor